MIKIAPRANISEEFMEVVIDTIQARLAKLKEEFEYGPDWSRDRWMKDNAGRIAVLKSQLTKEGQDTLRTKLRVLPFAEYKMVENRNAKYLVGVTREVIADEMDRGGRVTAKWNIGVYSVAVPTSSLVIGSSEGLHFVPQAPMQPVYRSYKRHMHHIAYLTNRFEETHNQLDLDPSTCQGTMGSLLTTVVRDGFIPEVFRVLYTYVSRYDAHSPLAGGISQMPWAKQVFA